MLDVLAYDERLLQLAAAGENPNGTFFKIMDAADVVVVVDAYTRLLINDRFCSRTSSSRCRQYCLSPPLLLLAAF